MNIVILDDYQDAVRKLDCAAKLEQYPAKVYTNTVKGIGQLSIRLKDADVIVLNRDRTEINRALVEKLPKLKLIVQTGRVGSHIDIDAATRLGIAVAEGSGSPVAAAELMEQHRITSVLVVDASTHLVGALNFNDLMRAKVI